MGEWKAQLSLRVRQDLRRELEGGLSRSDESGGTLARFYSNDRQRALRAAVEINRAITYFYLTNYLSGYRFRASY